MPSPKKVTLADIARKTSLSKGAVSFALKNSPMVSEKTRRRVQSAARAMGYKKNELVSSLMSKIRAGSEKSFSETIAVINGNLDEFALKNHPTLPRYYAGIRQEAARLGYAVNEFWMHAPGTNAEKLAGIFRSRGIRGGIVLGHSFGNLFPQGFEKIWRDFYFISAGIRSYNASLEVVASDDFLISHNAYVEAASLGCKNIGLVIDESVDDLVGGTLVGGFLRAQLRGGAKFKCPRFSNRGSLKRTGEIWQSGSGKTLRTRFSTYSISPAESLKKFRKSGGKISGSSSSSGANPRRRTGREWSKITTLWERSPCAGSPTC